jgi:cytochrome c biogenesis protein CcdA/glutaredoxin
MKRMILIFLLILLLTNIELVKAQEEVCIYFFYGQGCPHCTRAKSYIKSLESKYPTLELNEFNAAVESDLLYNLYDKYNVPENKDGYPVWGSVPILFIGDKYLFGEFEIIDEIESQIQICEEIGCECPEISEEQAEKEVSLYQLIGLAAVDAVNPCELAVLVILMTAILTRFPKKRKKALKTGLSFSLAILIMYFTFGLLIISGFRFITGYTQIGETWFYKILGAIAIILGILNIKDAIKYGGGGFVMEVPMGWRPMMKKLISGTTSVKGAFFVGLIVSFFLTPCTAGPYFVAGGILSNISLLDAIPYLLVYMLLFISPMIAITLIVYFGFMAVEDISGWREKNIKKLHWIAGLILLGLGIAMLLGWI